MNQYIILDQRLYPSCYIEMAIRDYKQVVPIDIEKQEGHATFCRVECPVEAFDQIRNEFCNYLIALISRN